MNWRLLSLAAAVSLLWSCESGRGPQGRPERDHRAAPPTLSTRVAEATQKPPKAPAAARSAPSQIDFRGEVEWHDWDDGRAIAAQQSKPIFVLVYADWCPHCRALGPVFADPELQALAKRFVMVRQNHDEDPVWLQTYNNKFGGYVPRIFFFEPSGKLREDITSGHPRYPFFYAAEQPASLKQSMRRVIGS